MPGCRVAKKKEGGIGGYDTTEEDDGGTSNRIVERSEGEAKPYLLL